MAYHQFPLVRLMKRLNCLRDSIIQLQISHIFQGLNDAFVQEYINQVEQASYMRIR
jgi:hypothetical protein